MPLQIHLALKDKKEHPRVLIANELAHLNQEQERDARFSLVIGLWIVLLLFGSLFLLATAT